MIRRNEWLAFIENDKDVLLRLNKERHDKWMNGPGIRLNK